MPGTEMAAQKGGIYVHVPFCVKKCAYCNFYSVDQRVLIADYVGALEAESRKVGTLAAAEGFEADTLYFGGGTPSLLTPEQVHRIIAGVRQSFKVHETSEITLEVNPGTVDGAKLALLRATGINRLSIGMQSFDDGMLKILGRSHQAADSRQVFAAARAAGFENISIDLIYGLPGQTKDQLVQDIEHALALGAEHLSAYMLSAEPETPLAQRLAEGALPAISEDFQRQAFDIVSQMLAGAGYRQYEISNFYRYDAGVDYRSRHNLKYWSCTPYVGLGPAAHAFYLPNRRSWNVSDLKQYLDRLQEGRLPRAEEELLTAEQLQIEMIYLGLRQNCGFELRAFDTLNPAGFTTVCGETLTFLRERQLVEIKDGFCALTAAGRPLLDYVTRTLVNAL